MPKFFAEVFNLLNDNTAIQIGEEYGNAYYDKTMMIVSPRIVRLGFGISF